MDYKIVFSDVDGTLLSSNHTLLDSTIYSIKRLKEICIPFVIVSGRGPSGIYPILDEYNFSCPIISFSGAHIADEKRNTIFFNGFSKEIARNVIDFVEKNKFDCSWNIYSETEWIVKDKNDERIKREERIVKDTTIEGNIDSLKDNCDVGKILLICNPNDILYIEDKLKNEFKDLSIFKSSNILIEIMQKGVNKGNAIKYICDLWNIPLKDVIAFGDNYNDIDMLKVAGMPYLMGNAPDDMKHEFSNITDDNNDDGIYNALVKLKVL